MATLSSELRNKLERVVVDARDAAEAGARAALEALAVHHHESYPHMKTAQRELRNHLRARARQLGDRQDASGRLAIDHVAGECAYEHWHRMLFARFLAENGLLIEPQEKMAISLGEAEELAKEDGVDVWVFASRCAQVMLPQIFRPEDPLLQVSLATEHMLKLERLLASLPAAVFAASDALGWVYQFWQSKKKDEVNRSEVKIGADEIAAVTQLFTEPYMVEFLLHNTLGAWWAGKKLTAKDVESAKTEEELRKKLAPPGVDWEYLRFVRGTDGKGGPWRPAAGRFDGWPKVAAELKVLDPCCGSGHFLVAALHHLVPIRMEEEGLSAAQAVDAVLRDNLHGLEIDERCCQIAAFALAFAAWTYPDGGGYRLLPELLIACTGIGPQATKAQWLGLAEEAAANGHIPAKRELDKKESLLSSRVAKALESLYDLFAQAPTLGSLINPHRLAKDLYQAGYEALAPLLSSVFKAEGDDETRERAIAAAGMVKAATLLVGGYSLVITNVPYLGMRKQSVLLSAYCTRNHPLAKHDLATVFVDRCLAFLSPNGTMAAVTPQNWLFLTSYSDFRVHLLRNYRWNMAARLGEGAFQSSQAAGAFVSLLCFSNCVPGVNQTIAMLDTQEGVAPEKKALQLSTNDIMELPQKMQAANPDARVLFGVTDDDPLLSKWVSVPQGVKTGDDPRWSRTFWEIGSPEPRWIRYQTSVFTTTPYGGRLLILNWSTEGTGMVRPRGDNTSVGRFGVVISPMRSLPATIYTGERYDSSAAPLVPADPNLILPLWAFCSSPEYCAAVRTIDKKVSVTTDTLAKVPFNLAHWQKVASKKYPDGLPEPESDDPTQWLFHGRPEESTAPLQVAVPRLLGYRWPAELDEGMRLSKRARALVNRCDELARFADGDGIVCIPAVRGEEAAAERLEALLSTSGVKPAEVRELACGADLDDWLRDSFFEEHCKLFHDRPFVWQIWDGRKRDGFHALVNYHKLCEGKGKGRKLLESLTYAYLGDWIARQKDGVKRGEGGAEDRLAAALELQNRLKSILEGEPPFDIFVRWKPLAEQPIGWEPDINDGVRMNIRPFLAADLPAGRAGAGVLRYKPNIKWTKDRGKEPERPKAGSPWFWGWDESTVDFMGGKNFDGNRHNDCHYTYSCKRKAREAKRG